MKRILPILFVGSCAFLGGGVVVTIGSRPPALAMAQSPSGSSAADGDLSKLSDRFEWVARRVSPAVVYVEATKPAKPANGKTNPVEESGSGVLIRIAGQPQTFVLTNNHVIARAAPEQVTITLSDGRLFKSARIGPIRNRTSPSCGWTARATFRPRRSATAIEPAWANGFWPSAVHLV